MFEILKEMLKGYGDRTDEKFECYSSTKDYISFLCNDVETEEMQAVFSIIEKCGFDKKTYWTDLDGDNVLDFENNKGQIVTFIMV